VSVVTSNDWQAQSIAADNATTVPQAPSRGQKVEIVRDTLIALGMQISFRIAMFLRHLNY
jgi:hypothetical protein